MKRVLFLGEGDLAGPARYLASVLQWARIPYDHRPDRAKIPKAWRTPGRYGAILLSDYRYAGFTPCSREWLRDEVTLRGAGLLMIGGWASFTGLVGGYAGTDIETLLPVQCVPGDDRVQKATGALLVAAQSSGLRTQKYVGFISELRALSSELAPPIICGYHRAKSRPGSQTVAVFRGVLYKKGRLQLGVPQPALVLGQSGRGRTAAFLTDCAPHWAGGLVDWGRHRVTVNIAPGISTEVGSQYLKFFTALIHSLIAR